LRFLLSTPNHVSVRDIARQLKMPSGHVFYHLKRMVETGILVRRNWTEEHGNTISEYVEYEPQPVFSEKNALAMGLRELEALVVDSTPKKVGICVQFMLMLSKIS